MKYKVGDLIRISRFWGSETGIVVYAEIEAWLDGFAAIYKIQWEDGTTILYTEDMITERAFQVIG
tara:strand:+ start:225 stop:419 length:195 start_codon:yes stop_codon:yes gene_type:complete